MLKTGLRRLATGRRTTKEIILLFRKIVGCLKTDHDSEKILGVVNKELDNTLPKVRSPHLVYERVITFLVGRKYAQEAVLIYQRMHEAGFISSNVLDAKMLAIALAVPNKFPQPLILRLAPIFTDPEYTEKDFTGLVRTMTKYEVDNDIICTLVEAYMAVRRPNSITRPEIFAPLLIARTRSGDTDVALELLDEFSGATSRNRAARRAIHAPYVQVLATLQETQTWDSISVQKVLDLMASQGLHPNLNTMNILLAREVRLGHLRAALDMYSLLKEMGITTKNISPDTFTFGSMFLLYRILRPKTVRTLHAHNPASPFPPRALYRDFMLAAKLRGRAKCIVPTTNLMNVILRAFIRQRDYAGAFVVLSSYFYFKLPLDNRTYYRVVKHVVRRIWIEVLRKYKDKGEAGWSVEFLGVPRYSDIELNEDLVRNLFAFISQDTFYTSSPLYAFGRHMPSNADPRYELPSMQMMESVFLPQPEDFHYDPVPLKRILRRAILANLRLENPNAGPSDVSKAIKDAKVDMLPKIPQCKSSTSSKAER